MRVYSSAITNNRSFTSQKRSYILIGPINSFAEVRGEAAHLSQNRYRTKQQIDPKNESDQRGDYLEGIRSCG